MPDIVTGSIGGLLIVGGLMMIFVFPDIHEYQSKAFSYTGMTIGSVMTAIGIALMVLT
jgi:hypothetical protein